MSGAGRLQMCGQGLHQRFVVGLAQVVVRTVKGCLFEKLKVCFVTAVLVYQG